MMFRHALVFVALALLTGFAADSGVAGAATELMKQVSLVFTMVSVAMLALCFHERPTRSDGKGKTRAGHERRRAGNAEPGT